MSRFFIEFKKWSEAYSDSLSAILENTFGEVEDVDFRFGPPKGNGLPCYITVKRRERLLFEISDIDPPFKELRLWMERATRLSSLSRMNPEMVSLDCGGRVLTLSLIPASWDNEDHPDMLSLLVVTESGCRRPIIKVFCRSLQTVGRLYRALMEATRTYGKEFSDPSRWKDPERFNGLEERTCAERIREELRSDLLEIRLGKPGNA